MTLFWQKTSLKKMIHNSGKTYIYFDKIKSFWKLMICCCYFCPQNFFFILWVAHNDSFFCANCGKKSNFFKALPIFFFFRTAGVQHKVLILIGFPNIFHWKPAKKPRKWVWSMGQNLGQIGSNVVKKCCISNRFFSYFAWGIHLKARSSAYRNTWVEIEGQIS